MRVAGGGRAPTLAFPSPIGQERQRSRRRALNEHQVLNGAEKPRFEAGHGFVEFLLERVAGRRQVHDLELNAHIPILSI